MNLVFQRLPMLPKEDNIYWCIIKSTQIAKEKTKDWSPIEYHYAFVKFTNGEFMELEMFGYTLEVVAWAELENPERHFKPKPLIISR